MNRAFQMIRKGRKLGIYQLAELAGVSAQTIYNIERADHNPTLRTRHKVMRAMGIGDWDHELLFGPLPIFGPKPIPKKRTRRAA